MWPYWSKYHSGWALRFQKPCRWIPLPAPPHDPLPLSAVFKSGCSSMLHQYHSCLPPHSLPSWYEPSKAVSEPPIKCLFHKLPQSVSVHSKKLRQKISILWNSIRLEARLKLMTSKIKMTLATLGSLGPVTSNIWREGKLFDGKECDASRWSFLVFCLVVVNEIYNVSVCKHTEFCVHSSWGPRREHGIISLL